MNDDEDVIPIGKLRRPHLPAAAISYDPTYGIRVEGEDAPRTPVAAAIWLKKTRGRVKFFAALPKGHPAVDEFVKAWRRRG